MGKQDQGESTTHKMTQGRERERAHTRKRVEEAWSWSSHMCAASLAACGATFRFHRGEKEMCGRKQSTQSGGKEADRQTISPGWLIASVSVRAGRFPLLLARLLPQSIIFAGFSLL